jgi:hypothetical protein
MTLGEKRCLAFAPSFVDRTEMALSEKKLRTGGLRCSKYSRVFDHPNIAATRHASDSRFAAVRRGARIRFATPHAVPREASGLP